MFIDNHLLINVLHPYHNWAFIAIMTIFLLIISITDLRTMKIPNWINVSFFLLRLALIPFWGLSIYNLIGAGLGFLILLIPAMIKMSKMGGDIKAMGVIGFYLGVEPVIAFIALSVFYSMVYLYIDFFMIKKKRFIPFAPFFFLANLTLIFLVLI